MPVSLAGLDYCANHPDNGCIVHGEGLTNSYGDELTFAALPLHLPMQRHKAFARAISLLAPTEKQLMPLVEHAGHHGVTATHAGSFLDTPSATLLSKDQMIPDQTSTQQHDSPLHVNGQGHGLGSAFLGDDKFEYVSEPYVDGANTSGAWAASLRKYKPLPNKLSTRLSKDAPADADGTGDDDRTPPEAGNGSAGHKCPATGPDGWVFPSTIDKKVCCCANVAPGGSQQTMGEDTPWLAKKDCQCRNWIGKDGKRAVSDKNDPAGTRRFSLNGVLIDVGDGCQCEFSSTAMAKMKKKWMDDHNDPKGVEWAKVGGFKWV